VCRAPGCFESFSLERPKPCLDLPLTLPSFRTIRIEKYALEDREFAEESRDKGDRPRRYKIHKDKDYCSNNCGVKAYYHEAEKPRKQKRTAKS
jgi:hypothetical protein